MAGDTEYEFRTFPGDPNPPATPPASRAGATAVADAPAESGGGAAPPPADASPTKAAKAQFSVKTDAEGNRSVFATDDSFQTTRLGPVSLGGDEATGLLDTLGRFNPITKSWSVDEGVARQLMSGEMPLPDYLPAKFRAQKAMFAHGAIGLDWVLGRISDEEADTRGNLEALKMQVKEAPAFVWNGSVLKMVAGAWKNMGGATGVARRTVGEAAAQTAQFTDPAMATSAIAGIMAPVALTAAASAGPAVAVAAPLLVKALANGPVFLETARIEAGNAALEMKAKGVPREVALKYALPIGVLNGFLEMGSFHALPANLRRLVGAKFLKNEAVKNLLVSATKTFSKEVGLEFSTESLQSVFSSIGENWALEASGMPEKKTGAGEVAAQALSEGTAAAMGAGLIKLPGAAAEVKMSAREEKAVAETKAALKERDIEAAADATPPAGAQPQTIETLPPPAPEREATESKSDGPRFDPPLYKRDTEILEDETLRVEGLPVAHLTKVQQGKSEGYRVHVLLNNEWIHLGTEVRPEEFPVFATRAAAEANLKEFMESTPGPWTEKAQQRWAKEEQDELRRRGREAKPVGAPEELPAPTEQKLLEDLNTGTAETFDDAVVGFEEEGTPEAAARLEAVVNAPPPKAETKTEAQRRELERKGRLADLRTRLGAVRERLAAIRTAWEANPTPALTEEVKKALIEESGIKQDLKFYETAKADKVSDTEAMEVKTPTFDAIMALGFKEGKAESKNRAQQILDIAKANGLTMRDVRRLLKNKRPELLGDKAFKNFMQGYDRVDEETGQVTHVPGFTERVERLLERKRAVKELRAIQHEKKIRGERNVRRLHDLPPVAEMTTEQVRQYAGILQAYDVGDVALTPERIRALETAAFGGMGGVRTAQDVVRRAVQNARAPLSAFNGIEVDALSLLTYDTPLARQHPFLNFMVNYFKATVSRADEVKAGVKTTLDLLGAKAMASRMRGLKGLISPAMPEVMAAIEEADATARAAKWEALTPEEREYATFWLTFAQAANDYLVAVDPNFVSRFSGGTYTPHVPKRASEIVASIPDKGLRAAVGELVDQIFPSDAADFFQAPRQQRQALGLRKFFQQTVFRTGQLDPSRNLIRAHREYIDAFYKKVAVDSAVPVIDSIVYGLQSISRDPDAEKLYNGVHAFTKEWLNAKKGNARLLFQKGDFGDRLLRAGMALMSLKYIAVNVALQVTAPVGEQAMEVMHLGARGYARAKKRRVSAQGRAILERYKFFTEENPWEQFKQPGRDAVEYLKMASYGMFQFYRTEVMADILLGSMTAEEFAAGEISHERLAEIKTAAGRWLDIHGAKSVIGSTAEGATWTQFKGWAIPPMTSVLSDLKGLGSAVAGGKKLTAEHFQDLYRASYFVLAYLLMKKGIEDEEDDSFLGQAKKRARREIFSLFQSIDPVMFAGPGVFGDFVVKLAKALKSLVTLEEYSPEGARAGELKGPAAVERLVKPAFVRQLESKEDVD